MPRTRGFGIQSPWSYHFVRQVAAGASEGPQPLQGGTFDERLAQFLNRMGTTEDHILRISAENLAEPACTAFLNDGNDKRVLIVSNLYQSPQALQRWQQLAQDERVTVSFDLFDQGICFFIKSTTKQHYKINYKK